MQLIIKVYEIDGLEKTEELVKEVNENNFKLVKAKLETDHRKIVDILRQMKEEGIINSVFIPRNKKIQDKLNNLVKINREIRNSIEKVSSVFSS